MPRVDQVLEVIEYSSCAQTETYCDCLNYGLLGLDEIDSVAAAEEPYSLLVLQVYVACGTPTHAGIA